MSVLRGFGYLTGGVTLGSLGYYAYWRNGEKKYPFNAYTTGEQAIDNIDLNGKTAIVTGCNTGIGKETARVLTKQGCNVIMACRSKSKAETARTDILNNLGLSSDYSKLSIMSLDLSSLDSVKSFADEYNAKQIKIDYLINNAGVMAVPDYRTTKDGFEMQFGINHLGHFYLTNLLIPSLFLDTDETNTNKNKNKPRIINVSSLGEGFSQQTFDSLGNMFDAGISEGIFYPSNYIDKYGATDSYSISKTSNILFTRELIKKYNNNIISTSLQPGVIYDTELTRHIKPSFSSLKKTIKSLNDAGLLSNPIKFLRFNFAETKDIPQGSATTLRCISLNDNEIDNGSFYRNCRNGDYLLQGPASNDNNGELAAKLWEMSKVLLESKGHSI